MDRLAARGTSFRLSYSANPVCCPARACWYTGRTSAETGVVKNSWPLAEKMPDLGQWFSARGYEAVYAGKWHIPNRALAKSFRLLTPGTGIGEHSDAAVSRAAEGFFRSYSGDKPFCLSLGFLQPHDICYWIFENSKLMDELPYPQIADELPPLPDNFEYDPREPESFRRQWRNPAHEHRNKWPQWQWRYYQWAYYRSVEMADAEVGRVIDALDDTGLAANTLVVFSADHGDGHARHRMISKMYMYDEAASVPFIVSWPGNVAEGVQDTEHLVSAWMSRRRCATTRESRRRRSPGDASPVEPSLAHPRRAAADRARHGVHAGGRGAGRSVKGQGKSSGRVAQAR